jgi:multidrug efflux pump subunit AcrB
VTWQVDPVMAGRLGLTVDQVANQLANAWSGEVATDLRLLDRSIPVRVRYPDKDRFNPERLGNTPVRGAKGELVPAATLAVITQQTGQEELKRENLRQMALVSARLEDRDLGSAVDEIRSAMAEVKFPVGYTFEVGGQYESQRQAFGELLTVFALAVVLVFVILVVQFRSFTSATLILAAAPLSIGGALALLLLTGTDLNVSSAMGLILLVGLVVKNGIVLLDFAEKRYSEGRPMYDAILAAARVLATSARDLRKLCASERSELDRLTREAPGVPTTEVPLFDHEVDSLVELRRVGDHLAGETRASARLDPTG